MSEGVRSRQTRPAVWNSSWPDWLRVALVICFAACWILVSLPRGRKGARP